MKNKKRTSNYSIFQVFKDTDKTMLLIILAFVIFGSLNIITSSTQEVANSANQSIFHYFIRQIVFFGLGTFAGIIAINIPSKKWKYISWVLYGILVLFLLYLVLNKNELSHRGAANWISLGSTGFKFQPSEFLKPILIILLASLYEDKRDILLSNNKSNDDKLISKIDLNIAFIFMVSLIPIGLIFLAKDLGGALIISFITFIIFLSSYIKKQYKYKIMFFTMIVFVFLVVTILLSGNSILSEAQKNRFNFFNPCSRYEQASGYQICNGFIAINNGGLFGLGIGHSKQKYSYLPEAHTDSIFAIIVEEYGLIISTGILLGYFVLIKRFLEAAKKATTYRGRYIIIGISAYFIIHIILNLGGLLGGMPLTGVPLPFLSYGGSYGFSLAFSMMLMQRIIYETNNTKIKIS